jgi:GrpB-like predicted nucleotidyltransferase (UPF0157 family)
LADKVIVAPYDSEWPCLFSELGAKLRKALGDVALRIDHIGSTSIPGMAAKPIIDVLISVADFEPLDAFRIPIESVGFVYRPNDQLIERDLSKRYFREKPADRRTHIHVRRSGSWSEQLALLFRDYKRTHSDVAMDYAELKYRLAEQYPDDRHSYSTSKGPFIWDVTVKADKWNQEVGWQPGPSDT